MGLKGTIYHVMDMSETNVSLDMGSREATYKVYNSSHTMRLVRKRKDLVDPVGSLSFETPRKCIETLFFKRGMSDGMPVPWPGLIQATLMDLPGRAYWAVPRPFRPLRPSEVPSSAESGPAEENTDHGKTPMEGASVPESLPAREGARPGGSSGSTGPSPSEVQGTRDPHYPDSDHDQRTLLMMLLQIQQHAPEWMQELDLQSNVLRCCWLCANLA